MHCSFANWNQIIKIEKEEIEHYAQLPIREALAQKCFQVAQFTEVPPSSFYALSVFLTLYII